MDIEIEIKSQFTFHKVYLRNIIPFTLQDCEASGAKAERLPMR